MNCCMFEDAKLLLCEELHEFLVDDSALENMGADGAWEAAGVYLT